MGQLVCKMKSSPTTKESNEITKEVNNNNNNKSSWITQSVEEMVNSDKIMIPLSKEFGNRKFYMPITIASLAVSIACAAYIIDVVFTSFRDSKPKPPPPQGQPFLINHETEEGNLVVFAQDDSDIDSEVDLDT
ncbi:hypothetical protein ACHQM5_025097 [Ranunculus cassubicifolius]